MTTTSRPAEHAHASVDSAPGTSRRTVLKSAAWSLPVIAIAVSMPAATASGGEAKLTLGFFEASWETIDTLQYLRGYLKLDNFWNNDASEQTTVTAMTAYFDVADEALADPLEAVTLEFDDPASNVGTWTYVGSSSPSSGVTRLTFGWTGSLHPMGTPSTVLEWRTRAGEVVFTGSGFDTTVSGAATSSQAGQDVEYSDTTGTPG